MQKKYSLLIATLKQELEKCDSQVDLQQIKSQYLGKKGKLTNEFNELKNIDISLRKELGQFLNTLKNKITGLIDLKKVDLESLKKHRIIAKSEVLKVLGNGSLKAKLEVHAHAFSKAAESAIESAGGKTVKL